MLYKPRVVVVDPISNYSAAGSSQEVKSMVTRLIDMFKSRQITALFTSLTTVTAPGAAGFNDARHLFADGLLDPAPQPRIGGLSAPRSVYLEVAWNGPLE